AAAEAQSERLAPAYTAIVQALALLQLAEQALDRAGQVRVLEQLRAELLQKHHGEQVRGGMQPGTAPLGTGVTLGHTGQGSAENPRTMSGPHVAGTISSGRDTNVASHLTVNNRGPSAPSRVPAVAATERHGDSQHLQSLLEAHTRRLQVL